MKDAKSKAPSSGELVHRLFIRGAQLEDFLSKGEFLEVMSDLRWRVIRVFAEARSAPGKRATPGYVTGLSDQLAELAGYLQRTMGAKVLAKVYAFEDLPAELRTQHSPRVQQFILRYVHHELIMRQLLVMKELSDIWYEGGDWCMPPTVLDEYLRPRTSAKDSYDNWRGFHGRPNRDRDCPVYRQGTSVGLPR